MKTEEADRANFVENRRRGIHQQEAAAAARQGLNVHENDRDQRTKDALKLLYSHQGKISKDRIRQAKDSFISYLDQSPTDQKNIQLARDALLKPRQGGHDFGPLISDTDFSILGFHITGENLIGRLWIYASTLSKTEQTNAKEGMISALSNSYYLNSRVCNQGKAQRLVVAVLQGRLKGVNIEGEIIPELVPTPQAVRMFFSTEARRDIDCLDALLEAANTFCAKNPRVNQEEFIQSLKEYAREQEMPGSATI